MTTDNAVPAISTLVELTAAGEPLRGVRVDEIAGRRMMLSPPADAPVTFGPGERVTLRWSAGHRGRWVLPGRVIEMVGTRLMVEQNTEPHIQQHREFVRGGGGEPIWMHRVGSGAQECTGWIRDISERSVRAAFAAVAIGEGDRLRFTFHLDADTIEVCGTAVKITVRPPEAPGSAATRVEVIAMLDADEVQAQSIRRYVLRQQVVTRTRTAG